MTLVLFLFVAGCNGKSRDQNIEENQLLKKISGLICQQVKKVGNISTSLSIRQPTAVDRVYRHTNLKRFKHSQW